MMVFGLFGMLLLLGILIVPIIGVGAWLFRGTAASEVLGQGLNQGRRPPARQILDERFARGEITRAEYDEMRSQIAV